MDNRRIVTIILALALIGFIFLPYVYDKSGFEIVTNTSIVASGIQMMAMKYIWLAIPLSGLILFIGAVNNGKYLLSRTIWALLPLITLLAVFGRTLTESRGEGAPATSELISMFGFGFWATAGVSLVLAFTSLGRKDKMKNSR